MNTPEIRVVLNQVGAALELHGQTPEPVMLALIRPSQLEVYRGRLAEDNPDMRYATIGQLSLMLAREMVKPETPVNPSVWLYNASTKEYSRA